MLNLPELEPRVLAAAPILLVDDEPANLRLLQAVLEQAGFCNLRPVADPRAVIQACDEHDVVLIVLDLNMPGLNGFDVLRALRGPDRPDVPQVLVLTALAQTEHLVRSLEEGASDYLTKPFNPVELAARARSLVALGLYQRHIRAHNRRLEAAVEERTARLWESREQIRELMAHLERVREAERAHVAREIHDELGQCLTALRLDVAMLEASLADGVPALADRVRGMKRLLDHTIGVARSVTARLRPPALDLGLVAAAEWLVNEFRTRTGVACELDVPPEELVLDDVIATALFRILQESLTNIARYARAKRVEVAIRREPDQIRLTVRDDGVGFDASATAGAKTFGILGMRERALMLGGSAQIDSRPGAGTSLCVVLPITGSEQEP